MPLYTGIGGTRREITEVPCGIGGVKRDVSEMWAGINGVKKQIFSSVKWSVTVNMSGMNFQGNAFYLEIDGEKVPWEYNTQKHFNVSNGAIITVSTPASSGSIAGYITWNSNNIGHQSVANPFSFVVDSDVQVAGAITELITTSYQWMITLHRDGWITTA